MASRILSVLALALVALGAAPCELRWYPVLSNRAEGLYVYTRNAPGDVTVTIEAEAGGKPLPTVTRSVDADTGWVDAPVGNLDTYRLTRMIVDAASRRWVLDYPKPGVALML